MKIIVIGDLHGEYNQLTFELTKIYNNSVDLIVLTGDIGADMLPAPYKFRNLMEGAYYGSLLAVAEVLKAARIPIIYIPGNHDPSSMHINAGNAHNIDILSKGQPFPHLNSVFWGIGGSTYTPGRFVYEYHEEEIIEKLEKCNLPEDSIIVTHCPPANSGLDKVLGTGPAGSTALRNRIPLFKPTLWICGHVHESSGVTIVDNVPTINAGGFLMPIQAYFNDERTETQLIYSNISWEIEINEQKNHISITKTITSLHPGIYFDPIQWSFSKDKNSKWSLQKPYLNFST